MKYFFLVMLSLLFITLNVSAQEIIIQENETGFCTIDGKVDIGSTSVTGWTGIGFADGDAGVGKSMSWQISVPAEGNYVFSWRFAVSGGDTTWRNAKFVVDGNIAKDTIYFPYTGTSWSNWKMSSPVEINLTAGSHKIRIEAHSIRGLANIDYLKVDGAGVEKAECMPSYVLNVKSNNDEWGSVSYSPVQNYYDKGTLVTIKAKAKPGYFFQSWTGEPSSADTVFTFAVTGNVDVVARFLPDGTKMDEDITGYATVQDDNGTPYLVTGGSLGETVEAFTLEDLQNYLGSSKPYIVKFSGELVGTGTIKITSDKTLIGTGDKAYLKGIELSINQARNVIIRNIAVSHVTPQDAVEINGKSKNIVIDHCEFFSDREHGVDYYDGLLDIKNESSFITISWCNFHDHEKTSLISSNDESPADSVIRVTYHHNYFHNLGSRLPSIRFGKAHVFNNYYKNFGSAINSRMGACVRVEKNYFEGGGKAVFMDYSATVGSVELIDNYFGTSTYSSEPSCSLNVPYSYENFLDETNTLPDIITKGVLVGVKNNFDVPYSYKLFNYPNPFNPSTKICFSLAKDSPVTLKIYNVIGQEVATLVNSFYKAGEYEVEWNASRLAGGIYFYRIIAGDFSETKKTILLK
ncbi:MAG: hypothetical protein BGN88_12240 [Clostridiales bacterium 43-6]|nr:MAG: hypothetical protein BGN88_12240 [Clostridiales bacterium 43-6]